MDPGQRKTVSLLVAGCGLMLLAAGVVVFALQASPIVGGVLLAAGATDLLVALFLSRAG